MMTKNLHYSVDVELIPTAPFDFDATVYKPGHFPSSDTRWEAGRRWQTLLWRGETLGLIVENAGNVDQPRVRLHVFSEKPLPAEFVQSVGREVEHRFNLRLELQDFYDTFCNDALLAPIIERRRGLRPMHPGDLYEYLIIAIVLQNTTVRRSVSMMQTLFDHYGEALHFDGQDFACFWQPQVLAAASEAELRALKVGYRAKSLLRVSQPFVDGQIGEMALRIAPVEEQKQRLLALYGIGPASVGYIMNDVFHRWDFYEHISPWEQKIFTTLFFGRDYHESVVPVSEMLDYFNKRFGKWKALAVHYVWEDLWWKRRNEHVPWLEELIRL